MKRKIPRDVDVVRDASAGEVWYDGLAMCVCVSVWSRQRDYLVKGEE